MPTTTGHHGDVASSAHLFQGASNVQIRGSLTATVNIQAENFKYWRDLFSEVAPNAILNAGGRADEVRCYPGTREQVISKAENWMMLGYRTDRRIFWLSGPAGAGKSAIMQTLAENCIERGILMAKFFFFRADPSRNLSRPLVPTLVHQLVKLLPPLKALINNIVAEDGLVLRASLREQFKRLIDEPVRAIRCDLADKLPIVLFVDGLDECDPRPSLDSAAKSEQRTILRVLHEFITAPDSPFIAILASRVESHIEMVFNDIGFAKDSIFLNEDYQPDADIRKFVTGELSRIKKVHPLGRRLDAHWPSASIMESIVAKSSGQFIYAATVIRFIENSPASPAYSMEMIMDIRPAQRDSPFAEVDALYTFILSRCAHWENVRDILALWVAHAPPFLGRAESYINLEPIGLSEDEAVSFFSDLGSIIASFIDRHESDETLILRFYHASFLDFLFTKRRGGLFFVDSTNCADRPAPDVIRRIHSLRSTKSLPFLAGLLLKTSVGNEATLLALDEIAEDWENSVLGDFTEHHSTHFLSVVERLSGTGLTGTYQRIQSGFLADARQNKV